MSAIMYKNVLYSGGDGTNVIANPSGEATATLNKLQVGNIIYSLPSGGGNETVGYRLNSFNAVQNNVNDAVSTVITSEIV